MAEINVKHIFGFYATNTAGVLTSSLVGSPSASWVSDDIVKIGCFTRIGGLSMEVDVQDWKTGCDRNMDKIPGLPKYNTITLDKGFDSNLVLKLWFDLVYSISAGASSTDNYKLKSYIFVADKTGTPKYCFAISDSWVSKYEAEDLDAKSTDPWVEKAELQHKGFEMFTVLTSTDSGAKFTDITYANSKGTTVTEDQDGVLLPDNIDKIIS